MRVSCTAFGLVVLAACTPESRAARDSAERVEVELVDSMTGHEQDGAKVLYRTGAITVTFQRVQPRAPGGRPTLEQVADALVRRYTGGEVEGSLAERACTVGGARCIDGHIVREGERIERRGFLVDDGEDVVLVEVLGTAHYATRVDEQVERAKESFRWIEG